MHSSISCTLLSLAALAAAQQCDLQFDGRVPANFDVDTFDDANGIFNPDNVLGAGKRGTGTSNGLRS
jgi:hypothetical protein